MAGEENSNDTWLAFYRSTGMLLKQGGVALLRIDHSGKEATKGQRGGSAKSGDVDVVWRLSETGPEEYLLECEKNRFEVPEKRLVLLRETMPVLRHVRPSTGLLSPWQQKVADTVADLDRLGAPDTAGRPACVELLRDNGVAVKTDIVAEAVRTRKSRNQVTPNSGVSGGQHHLPPPLGSAGVRHPLPAPFAQLRRRIATDPKIRDSQSQVLTLRLTLSPPLP